MIRAYDDYGNVVDLVEWEKQIKEKLQNELSTGLYVDGFNDGYKKGRADQKEEDNEFFNFEGAWELEKKKVRADAIDEYRKEMHDMIEGNEEFTDWQKYEILQCNELVAEQLKEQK